LYSSNLSKIEVIFNSFAICAIQYVIFYKHQRLSNTLSYSPDCSPSSMLSYHTAYTEEFPCWMRFFRAFSSVVRQMPGYNSQRRNTARTLPN
jgi:hypothetical protein